MLNTSCHRCVVLVRWSSQLQVRLAPMCFITLVHLCVADAMLVVLLPSISVSVAALVSGKNWVKGLFASEDRRWVVAAAALRKALHLSYRHAVEIYGMVLVQLTRQISRLQEEVLWRILTFASDVPQIVEALGISELSEAVTGWDCDVFQRQSLLHRIISVVQQEYVHISSAGAWLPPQPACYENWRPQAFP